MKEPQETVTLPKGAWAAIVNALGNNLQGPPRAVQALLNVVDAAKVELVTQYTTEDGAS